MSDAGAAVPLAAAVAVRAILGRCGQPNRTGSSSRLYASPAARTLSASAIAAAICLRARAHGGRHGRPRAAPRPRRTPPACHMPGRRAAPAARPGSAAEASLRLCVRNRRRLAWTAGMRRCRSAVTGALRGRECPNPSTGGPHRSSAASSAALRSARASARPASVCAAASSASPRSSSASPRSAASAPAAPARPASASAASASGSAACRRQHHSGRWYGAPTAVWHGPRARPATPRRAPVPRAPRPRRGAEGRATPGALRSAKQAH